METPTEDVKQIETTDLFAVAEWLLGDDTGISSKQIAATWIAGKVVKSKWHGAGTPGDAPDLGRCMRLLEKAPAVRDCFPMLRQTSPFWAALVDHWDELTELHTGTPSPKWYVVVTDRMRELSASANDQGHAAARLKRL